MMKINLTKMALILSLTLPLVSLAADGDSLKTKVEDTVITAKVKAAFASDKVVSASDVKVETDSDGLVQLSGTVKSQTEADRAVALTKATKGVTAVKNDINVVN